MEVQDHDVEPGEPHEPLQIGERQAEECSCRAAIFVQGGPSASGKKYVDFKFKVPSLAWVIGRIYS